MKGPGLLRRLTCVGVGVAVADSSSEYEKIDREDKVSTCPPGNVPVYVGDDDLIMERFAVPAELLNRPVFAQLLNRSAQKYGYDQKGVLRIPCSVSLFRTLLADADTGTGTGTGENI